MLPIYTMKRSLTPVKCIIATMKKSEKPNCAKRGDRINNVALINDGIMAVRHHPLLPVNRPSHLGFILLHQSIERPLMHLLPCRRDSIKHPHLSNIERLRQAFTPPFPGRVEHIPGEGLLLLLHTAPVVRGNLQLINTSGSPAFPFGAVKSRGGS
jgi:hypothetical protein